MSFTRIKLGKCRVVFFDLEFYVPERIRSESTFSYNPWDKSCKLLGGSFLLANPDKDFGISESKIRRRVQSKWLWQQDSERLLLQSILELLNRVLEIVDSAHDGKVSPILCGIGIISSDVPILFELFKRYNFLTNTEAFCLQNRFRVIDLSVLSIGAFKNGNYFLYPKNKAQILHKYINDKSFDSGTCVWELYERKEYKGIESRVIDEVVASYQCYELIMLDFNRLKSLEKTNKNIQRQIDRLRGATKIESKLESN